MGHFRFSFGKMQRIEEKERRNKNNLINPVDDEWPLTQTMGFLNFGKHATFDLTLSIDDINNVPLVNGFFSFVSLYLSSIFPLFFSDLYEYKELNGGSRGTNPRTPNVSPSLLISHPNRWAQYFQTKQWLEKPLSQNDHHSLGTGHPHPPFARPSPKHRPPRPSLRLLQNEAFIQNIRDSSISGSANTWRTKKARCRGKEGGRREGWWLWIMGVFGNSTSSAACRSRSGRMESWGRGILGWLFIRFVFSISSFFFIRWIFVLKGRLSCCTTWMLAPVTCGLFNEYWEKHLVRLSSLGFGRVCGCRKGHPPISLGRRENERNHQGEFFLPVHLVFRRELFWMTDEWNENRLGSNLIKWADKKIGRCESPC